MFLFFSPPLPSSQCGRYCQNDPDLDPSKGASGSDVVMEQARMKCVWKYGNQTNARTLWFKYVNQHAAACVNAANKWDGACSTALIQSLGVPDSFMTSCMGNGAMTYTSDTAIAVLEEDLAWMREFQPLPPPQLFVNEQPYRGSLACPDPISSGSCPPLQMVCTGSADGTAPAACLADSANGGGGTSTSSGGSGSKFPTGAVIGVIIAAVFVIGVVVFFYVRRRETAMKDDIDQLLKQYLPMDEGGHGVTAHPDRRTIDRRSLIAAEDEHNVLEATQSLNS